MRVIDSHTEGEPTRLVVSGGPDLGGGPLSNRIRRFAAEHDAARRFCLMEPRGHDAVVGALLVAPEDPTATAGLLFFNNAGTLGMCGHATIGAVVTLAHMGRIGPGLHRIETPVGTVTAELTGRNRVSVENVPSHVHRRGVVVDVAGLGPVSGSVAWGGNWFFLTDDVPAPIRPENIRFLTAAAAAVKAALAAAGVTGADGAPVDHVEFTGPGSGGADGRNFVLCPGDAYDRSPCGTGTSAKLALLAAEGLLDPGETWVQDSVVGGRFEASYRLDGSGRVVPRITGNAYVTAEATLILDPSDPFPTGIGA